MPSTRHTFNPSCWPLPLRETCLCGSVGRGLLSHLEHSPRHCSGTRRWWHHPLRDSSLWWRLLSIGIHLLHARHALPRPILFHIRCSGCAGLKSGVLDAHAARHSQLILISTSSLGCFNTCFSSFVALVALVKKRLLAIGLRLPCGVGCSLCALVATVASEMDRKEWRPTCISAVSTQLTKCCGIGELPNLCRPTPSLLWLLQRHP